MPHRSLVKNWSNIICILMMLFSIGTGLERVGVAEPDLGYRLVGDVG